jgi:hypothetical protein
MAFKHAMNDFEGVLKSASDDAWCGLEGIYMESDLDSDHIRETATISNTWAKDNEFSISYSKHIPFPKINGSIKSHCDFWTAYLSGGWPDLSIDLVAAVQCQMNFMDKVVPLMIPGGLAEDKPISGGRKPHVKLMALM